MSAPPGGADVPRVKGVVFNMLERLVVREHGESVWDGLLAAASVDGAYTSLGSYDDDDLFALVGAASDTLGMPPDEIVRWFGREALPMFAEGYPELFSPHDNARDFILTLNGIIHPQVRKLYPGANVPEFGYGSDNGPDSLRLTYRSERQLCSFAEGLIEGAATHYGQTATVEQPTCLKRGDDHCTIDMRFAS